MGTHFEMLQTFFRHFAESLTVNGHQFPALLDKRTRSQSFGQVNFNDAELILTIQSSDVHAAGIEVGTLFEIRGKTFEAIQIDDDLFGIHTITIQEA